MKLEDLQFESELPSLKMEVNISNALIDSYYYTNLV